jgi:hypothetical protein
LLQQGRVALDADSDGSDETKSRRAWWRVASPAWTDFNDRDPGVTLAELFAFLAEALLYLLSQVDEEQRRRRRRRLALLVVGAAGIGGYLWTQRPDTQRL